MRRLGFLVIISVVFHVIHEAPLLAHELSLLDNEAPPLLAQRAGHHATSTTTRDAKKTDKKPNLATRGMPGLFDSNMVERDKLVVDFIFGSMDYGYSPDLTIGINAWMLLPLLGGGYGIMLKARSLVYNEGKIDSAITTYLGQLSFEMSFKGPRMNYIWLTSNTSYYARNQVFTFNVHYYNFAVKSGDINANLQDIDPNEKVEVTDALEKHAETLMRFFNVGLDYKLMFSRNMGLNLTFGVPLYASLEMDTLVGSISLISDFSANSIFTPYNHFVRLGADLRASRTLLISGGVFYTRILKQLAGSESSDIFLPWVSIIKQFR